MRRVRVLGRGRRTRCAAGGRGSDEREKEGASTHCGHPSRRNEMQRWKGAVMHAGINESRTMDVLADAGS
jgi:hypothetical protein